MLIALCSPSGQCPGGCDAGCARAAKSHRGGDQAEGGRGTAVGIERGFDLRGFGSSRSTDVSRKRSVAKRRRSAQRRRRSPPRKSGRGWALSNSARVTHTHPRLSGIAAQEGAAQARGQASHAQRKGSAACSTAPARCPAAGWQSPRRRPRGACRPGRQAEKGRLWQEEAGGQKGFAGGGPSSCTKGGGADTYSRAGSRAGCADRRGGGRLGQGGRGAGRRPRQGRQQCCHRGRRRRLGQEQ